MKEFSDALAWIALFVLIGFIVHRCQTSASYKCVNGALYEYIDHNTLHLTGEKCFEENDL